MAGKIALGIIIIVPIALVLGYFLLAIAACGMSDAPSVQCF